MTVVFSKYISLLLIVEKRAWSYSVRVLLVSASNPKLMKIELNTLNSEFSSRDIMQAEFFLY
jgi:hypothetical protein